MEPGAPAGSSQRPMVHAAGSSWRPVEPTAGPSRRSKAPTAGPSQWPVESSAGPSQRPMKPTAGPSRRSMAPTADPSQRPVDLTAGPRRTSMAPTAGPSQMSVEPIARPSRRSKASTVGPSSSSTSRSGVNVRIVEQPSKKAPKFRYESENRIPEPILGASSTDDRKTYTAIEITEHIGKADIVVSCVTKDAPYRPHPHKLAGHGYKRPDGVFIKSVNITPENRVVTFSNIGIVCVTKKDIAKSLELRKTSEIDPYHKFPGKKQQSNRG